MILIIDNYDSFTYNLVQYFRRLGEEIQVWRHDTLTVPEVMAKSPELVVLSPGPGTPDQAGICLELVRNLQGILPILGICLGHQVIAQALGGRIVRAIRPVHGKVQPVRHTGRGVFAGLNNPLQVTRYHSLVVERDSLPAVLEITAWSQEGEIMGLKHRQFLLEGVQFHPEAILTEQGIELLAGFLAQVRRPAGGLPC